MTTAPVTPVANFTPVDGAGLESRGGTATFFAISPVKGARVEGIASVGVTSHELDAPERYAPKVTHPAMWIDFTPNYDRASRNEHNRRAVTINGREYGHGFAETVGARVELFPVSQYGHLVDYGYPVLTLAGVEYVARFSMNTFDNVSDAARRVLEAVSNAIAVEYLTTVRWTGHVAAQAERSAGYAADALNEAQAKYDTALAAMQAAQAAHVDALRAAEADA